MSVKIIFDKNNDHKDILRKESGKEFDESFAKSYLERTASTAYYKSLDQGRPEDQVQTKIKLSKLLEYVKNPRNFVSIGADGGEEIHAAVSLFGVKGTDVYGIDLDSKTLRLARERLDKYGLSANLIIGSAVNLPLASNSVDILLASSIMHEVYSYMPDGREAWRKSFVEAARTLSEGGVLLVRDFSATPSDINVDVEIKSGLSQRFYDYFRSGYRVFHGWGDKAASISDRRTGMEEDYPKLDSKTNKVNLTFSRASELIMHFRNFKADYNKGLVSFDDPMWKEINEIYLPPDPDRVDFMAMSRVDYANRILHVANASLTNTLYKLECVANDISPRPLTAEALNEDFKLQIVENDKASEELLLEVTNKMELVFKKVRKDAFL